MKRLLILAFVVLAACTPAYAKGPGPSPPKGPSPSPSPSPTGTPGPQPCESDADPFPASPDPVPYADTSPSIIVTGYMGASMGAEGYQALGGTRMTTVGTTGVAVLPNLGLAHMIGDQYRFCGAWHSPFWAPFFQPQVGGESAVWLLAATTDDEWGSNGGAGAIRPRLEAVVAKIRTYTNAPIYATAPPPMTAFPTCKSLLPVASAATWDAINSLAADGGIEVGPTLPDLDAAHKLNRCHPNDAGKALWGQALLDFFGATA